MDWLPVEEDPALHGTCGCEYADVDVGAYVDESLHASTRAWLAIMSDPELMPETDDSTLLVTCRGLKVI